MDWSITDAKLFSEAPTQPGMMIDDTVRQVFVHMLLLTEIFRYVMNLAKVSHGMDR